MIEDKDLESVTEDYRDELNTLRADYLLYAYRVQLFKNSHNGKGFRQLGDNLESQSLFGFFEDLVKRALEFCVREEEPLTPEFWKKRGYNLK